MKGRSAVLYQANTPFVVEEVNVLEPRAHELLIRVGAAGICRSDHHFLTGKANIPLPCILGHEGAGIVAEVGEGVTSFKPGDRVVMSFVSSCGFCHFCSIGKPYLCDTHAATGTRMLDDTYRIFKEDETPLNQMGKVACFGEYTVVPDSAAIPLPPDLPLDQAALIGCCVTTGIGAVIYNARVEPGSTVAVIGCGGVGVNVIQGARLVNASKIIGVDILDTHLDFARELGATHTVNASREDAVARIRELTGGLGADYTFEVFGSSETIRVAYDAARKGGTVVVVGLAPRGDQVSFDAVSLVRLEKTVKGTYYGSARPRLDMPRIIEMAQQGQIELERLVTRHYTLDQINEGFEALERGDVGRGVLALL